MIPQTLIQEAARDGLTLAPTDKGTLRVHGPKAALAKWAPILKERKAEVLAALNPSPGSVPLTADETLSLRAWLAFIGETDKATIEDVLRACERSLTTRAHWLREARFTEAAVATRAASEAFEERAAILEYEGGLSRKEAERIAQLSRAFYAHLMARTGCCYAPHDRYCPEGQRLRDAYYTAAKAAGRLA